MHHLRENGSDNISDTSKRSAHNKSLDCNSNKKVAPNYRKVYAPQPPAGFKIFNPKIHFDMHYGDGMMREEIEKIRKRAEKASGRFGGDCSGYKSPLGDGFHFEGSQLGGNPFSRSMKIMRDKSAWKDRKGRIEDEYEFEENYIDLSWNHEHASTNRVSHGRETVTKRMIERRKRRLKKMKDPKNMAGKDESCVVM